MKDVIPQRRKPTISRMQMPVNSPIKYHGGKHYRAGWIIRLAARHQHWVEPYGGGLSVTLAKDPTGVSEVINDINGQLMNFWKVLQGPELFQKLVRRIEATPFSESEWEAATAVNNSALPINTSPEEQVERAVAFFVAARQSRAGQFRDFATVSRNRTRRKMNEQASAWLSAIDGLPAVHARLKRILILNQLALDVIKSQDGPSTLFYLDPPYLPETRVSPDVYAHEMTVEDHAQLLDVLSTIKGKFMLSGYMNDLYLATEKKHGWNRHEQRVPNNAAGGAKKRLMVECVWTNY